MRHLLLAQDYDVSLIILKRGTDGLYITKRHLISLTTPGLINRFRLCPSTYDGLLKDWRLTTGLWQLCKQIQSAICTKGPWLEYRNISMK